MLTGELKYVRDNIYSPTWVLMYKLKWAQLADIIIGSEHYKHTLRLKHNFYAVSSVHANLKSGGKIL